MLMAANKIKFYQKLLFCIKHQTYHTDIGFVYGSGENMHFFNEFYLFSHKLKWIILSLFMEYDLGIMNPEPL